MLPLIGGFVISLIGSFIGKKISAALEPKPEAPKTQSGPEAARQFSSALSQETSRLRESPDASAAGWPAMPALPSAASPALGAALPPTAVGAARFLAQEAP